MVYLRWLLKSRYRRVTDVCEWSRLRRRLKRRSSMLRSISLSCSFPVKCRLSYMPPLHLTYMMEVHNCIRHHTAIFYNWYPVSVPLLDGTRRWWKLLEDVVAVLWDLCSKSFAISNIRFSKALQSLSPLLSHHGCCWNRSWYSSL
jgi:hypothetical protein